MEVYYTLNTIYESFLIDINDVRIQVFIYANQQNCTVIGDEIDNTVLDVASYLTLFDVEMSSSYHTFIKISHLTYYPHSAISIQILVIFIMQISDIIKVDNGFRK